MRIRTCHGEAQALQGKDRLLNGNHSVIAMICAVISSIDGMRTHYTMCDKPVCAHGRQSKLPCQLDG